MSCARERITADQDLRRRRAACSIILQMRRHCLDADGDDGFLFCDAVEYASLLRYHETRRTLQWDMFHFVLTFHLFFACNFLKLKLIPTCIVCERCC